ncbi:MAG: cupin domain-containing protein [Candidatus Bipolaricaulota bacterium]|nr:cupin domain-containing protein [Candidatus Bipolaricaulota bacterium]MBS3791331.1 cupin domain-containing protein [Candidatus Bipolaricaulota bacterium]
MDYGDYLKEEKSYEGYYEFPFKPENKEPVVIKPEDRITEIYPPDRPHTSNIVWVWASTDLITQTEFVLSPGAFFGPPDSHAGDEMYYVLSGTLTEIQPELGTVIEAEAGDAILIPKGSFHQSYNFGDEEANILCAIAPRMWDETGPAPEMEGDMKLFKAGKDLKDSGGIEDVKFKQEGARSIDRLGEYPMDGEKARARRAHIKIEESQRLPVIHGEEHPIIVRFIVSNDLLHMAELQLPSGGEGPRTSEAESHQGDETLYVTEGKITVFFPDRKDAIDVPEGRVALIPEGVEHQYQNFTDGPVKGIFSVAPGL